MMDRARKSTSDGPLSRKGLAKAIDRPAKKKVPKKFRTGGLSIDPEPFVFKQVRGRELDKFSKAPFKPFIPEWMDQTHKPRRAIKFGSPNTKVRFRGKKVDPLVVLGADDRISYNDTTYPWVCVCKIITAVGTGSGVIVGPRHVLTASHVVNWSSVSGATGSVEVHRAGAAVSAISPIVQVYAFTRITGRRIGATELDEDYAVIVTADRIGDFFGWLGARTYKSRWDDEPYWMNIGYPGDVAGALFPIFQQGRELDEFAADFGSARAMETNADINPGQSGSPMFSFWREGPYAVAVVSAHNINDRENYCSGGRDLPRLVRLARDRSP